MTVVCLSTAVVLLVNIIVAVVSMKTRNKEFMETRWNEMEKMLIPGHRLHQQTISNGRIRDLKTKEKNLHLICCIHAIQLTLRLKSPIIFVPFPIY